MEVEVASTGGAGGEYTVWRGGGGINWIEWFKRGGQWVPMWKYEWDMLLLIALHNGHLA